MPRRASVAVGLSGAALVLALAAHAVPARADEQPAAIRSRVDVEAAQAILAVQGLDGWLLAGGPQNPVATELVNPVGAPTRQWFFFIPASGAPSLLTHASETTAFEDVPGRKFAYKGFGDMKRGVRDLVRGAHKLAMEYAPKSGIPSLTRVDAGTVDLVRATGVEIASSAELVQFTKSLWGPEGRVAHYVAMHHLERLIAGAFEQVSRELAAGHRVGELDLQHAIEAGFALRGIEGPSPIVAAGPHTADPLYAPTARTDRAIALGDLVLIDLGARLKGAERPIYARLAWVGYVGEVVPDRLATAFGHVAAARDRTMAFIAERAGKKRPVKGYEADQQARAVLGAAGLGERALHRTGHSLDTSLFGDGANLDDHETHDTRSLVLGSGYAVGPGVYLRGDFGVRTITDLYVGRAGVERTGPAQRRITPLSPVAAARVRLE